MALGGAAWTQANDALDAALEWLILVDNADYAGAWEMTDEVFKTAMSRGDWVRRITSAKAPLGRLIAREFRSSEAASNPPGAPAGEYVVIRFDTRFQNAQRTLETVVMHREADGRWTVSGYFIRPQR